MQGSLKHPLPPSFAHGQNVAIVTVVSGCEICDQRMRDSFLTVSFRRPGRRPATDPDSVRGTERDVRVRAGEEGDGASGVETGSGQHRRDL